MDRLANKVALVTGAAGGIGRAVAERFLQAGAEVVVTDRDDDAVDRLVADLAPLGTATGVAADLGDPDAVREAVQACVRHHGRLDVVANVAGRFGEPDDRDLASTSIETWDSIMAVNLRGTMLVCREAVTVMLAGGGGSIVNVSSVGSLFGDYFGVAYGTSKGGLNSLTRYIATAYGKQKIRCNAVLPAMIATPRLMDALPPGMAELATANHLTPYVGEPADVAHSVLFLASDESRFITGSMLVLDGGYTAHSPTYGQLTALLGGAG